jgi:hypothetical protein
LFAGYQSWEKLIMRYLLQLLHWTSQLLIVSLSA